MKLAKKLFFGLLVLGIVGFISGVSFAQTAPAAGKDAAARKAKYEAKIKLLQDSAAALAQINPDLSKKLSDIVADTKAPKEKMEAGKDKTIKDSTDWKARHEARIQLFKDAAVALQQTNPDLAKGLEDLTAPKHKAEMQKAEPKADK